MFIWVWVYACARMHARSHGLGGMFGKLPACTLACTPMCQRHCRLPARPSTCLVGTSTGRGGGRQRPGPLPSFACPPPPHLEHLPQRGTTAPDCIVGFGEGKSLLPPTAWGMGRTAPAPCQAAHTYTHPTCPPPSAPPPPPGSHVAVRLGGAPCTPMSQRPGPTCGPTWQTGDLWDKG